VLRGLDEIFRAVAISFDEMLRDAVRATKGIIDEAVARRSQSSFESAPALQLLGRYKEELTEVRNSLDRITIERSHEGQ
jgi:hypothetical protein